MYERAREIFHEADVDSSGFLDTVELCGVLTKLYSSEGVLRGKKVVEAEVRKAIYGPGTADCV